MADHKPTNGELFLMLENLRELAGEKHKVQAGFLQDIKDATSDVIKMIRGVSIEQQNLGREFDLMVKDFELYKLSTDGKIREHESSINQNTKGRRFIETWYFKIVGGVTVISSAIALGFAVAYVLNRNPEGNIQDFLKTMSQAEVQEVVDILQIGLTE